MATPSPHLEADATALVIGAGGLGCPVVASLSEAGVGRIVLVDHDVVEPSNLQRQVLFGLADVGRPKVEVAAERVAARWPGTRVVPRRDRLGDANVDALMREADVVVDATDDPEARFRINDRALAHRVPAVIAGVIRFEGLVVAVPAGRGPCFRCLFESPPEPHEVQSCAASGVLGAMAGLVGHLQAERALALLSGDEDAAHAGFVTTVDGLRGRIRDVPLPDGPGCPACRPRATPTRAIPPSQKETTHMSVTIKIPTSLRKFAGGEDAVSVEAASVREALDGLESAHPGIKAKICDSDGNLRRFVNVYADQEDIRFLDNLETPLQDGTELQIVPAIAGGR
ncbi:MAG: ThiF family adenylyltransferase [Myxococcota bacterium]